MDWYILAKTENALVIGDVHSVSIMFNTEKMYSTNQLKCHVIQLNFLYYHFVVNMKNPMIYEV